MEYYQIEVIRERNDLFTKIAKLKYYLYNGTAIAGMLIQQLETMELYLKILDKRIEGFIS